MVASSFEALTQVIASKVSEHLLQTATLSDPRMSKNSAGGCNRLFMRPRDPPWHSTVTPVVMSYERRRWQFLLLKPWSSPEP
jgi:hypothetical protein